MNSHQWANSCQPSSGLNGLRWKCHRVRSPGSIVQHMLMSLSYYRQCLDQLLPLVQNFATSLEDIRGNHQLHNDVNLMKSIDFTEETINGTLANITGRLESFDKSTSDMWRNLSAERFRKIEQLITSYHTTIGGVLCALSVKLNAWTNPVSDACQRRPGSARGLHHVRHAPRH